MFALYIEFIFWFGLKLFTIFAMNYTTRGYLIIWEKYTIFPDYAYNAPYVKVNGSCLSCLLIFQRFRPVS